MTTKDAFQIRQAALDDGNVIAEFNIALCRETEDRELDRATVVDGVANFLRGPKRGVYFVAEVDGRVIGQTAITYEWSDWRNGELWWIQSVYVHEEYRGFGIFRALYKHVQSLAKADVHCCGIRLYMERDNSIARKTYLKLGLVETGYEVFESSL
jgi:GNAT superfamily N-acetyltransferase